MKDILEANGVGIHHHFGGGVYAKETRIPAGKMLTQHSHPHDHLSVLGSGSVVVSVDGKQVNYTAPACILIEAGKVHSVTALTFVVWYCIHATHDTNADTVDATILHV